MARYYITSRVYSITRRNGTANHSSKLVKSSSSPSGARAHKNAIKKSPSRPIRRELDYYSRIRVLSRLSAAAAARKKGRQLDIPLTRNKAALARPRGDTAFFNYAFLSTAPRERCTKAQREREREKEAHMSHSSFALSKQSPLQPQSFIYARSATRNCLIN